jgi:hypothetical protein
MLVRKQRNGNFYTLLAGMLISTVIMENHAAVPQRSKTRTTDSQCHGEGVVFTAFRRLRQEDLEFQVNQGYTGRCCLK